jgi:hypothetical protein
MIRNFTGVNPLFARLCILVISFPLVEIQNTGWQKGHEPVSTWLSASGACDERPF